MAKTVDPDLTRALRDESERTKDQPYPAEAELTRPNRSRVYSVRLSPSEEERVQQLAMDKHLPPINTGSLVDPRPSGAGERLAGQILHEAKTDLSRLLPTVWA